MASESLRIFLRMNRSLSVFRQVEGVTPNSVAEKPSEDEYIRLRLGDRDIITQNIGTCVPGNISNLRVTSNNPSGVYGQGFQPPYSDFNFYVDIAWDANSNATNYVVTAADNSGRAPIVVYTPGALVARVFYNGTVNNTTITVYANTLCGRSLSATTDAYPCFLAGSLVQMADGKTKAIENVAVGDSVVGAFGEINKVLALHRPLVGDALMCKINDEHSTTNHHPHISLDKKFYCGNPALVENSTYGLSHKVVDGSGNMVDMMLVGLKKGRVQKLELGVQLKTVEGSRLVCSLETYSLPADTQLYNLVLGGSHTYHVDGYAVTGWPREDDFDYDTWVAIDTDPVDPSVE